MDQNEYSSIRSNLKTGDLVAFGGHTFISASIKAITESNVSHVGMILKVKTAETYLPIIMIVESTSMGDGFAGVRISRLSTRTSAYDGDIWILPVTSAINQGGVESFLVSKLGVPYDYIQALGSAFDFPLFPDQKEDLDKLFCSELCNEVYSLNLLDSTSVSPNSSEQTPIDVCRLPIYLDVYQVSGSPKELF